MRKGLQEIQDARVLFLDMNSFFASVEQQYRPETRGKPLAVLSHMASKATVLAASYEAKAFGVRTGMRHADALQLCPELLAVETEHTRYRAIHERFMTILRDICGPEVHAHSIDEAAFQLPRNWRTSETAHSLALRIKEQFRKELGPYIRCSVGIAPNSFLAKVASNLHKPDGLSEINKANLEATLARLKLDDLPGIAHRMTIALGLRGIHTTSQFYAASADELRSWMGIGGQYWWWRLHGYESQPDNDKPHKSISHQHVLEKWLYTKEGLGPVTTRMADRLVSRLRRNRYQCGSVWIYISVKGGPALHAERSFDSPTGTYLHLMQTLDAMVASLPQPLGPIRKVTLGFSNLSQTHEGMQLDLFVDRTTDARISNALDYIRQRHGSGSIQLGSVIGLHRSVAKEQLGFGRLKDQPFIAKTQ